MAYSIDPIQDNCYPGTTVLVNKLHIHDEAALQEAEALATYVNASKLEQCPLEGVFDFAHYKAIHQFLFSDLYDWAGQIRMVNISKKGTDFCRELWGPKAKTDNQILRVNMANIRRKIEKDPSHPEYLFTEVGVGYRMREGD